MKVRYIVKSKICHVNKIKTFNTYIYIYTYIYTHILQTENASAILKLALVSTRLRIINNNRHAEVELLNFRYFTNLISASLRELFIVQTRKVPTSTAYNGQARW